MIGGGIGLLRIIAEFMIQNQVGDFILLKYMVEINYLYFAVMLFFISVSVLYAASYLGYRFPGRVHQPDYVTEFNHGIISSR